MDPQRIAPEVARQRLLVEGYYGRPVDRASLRSLLLGLAASLGLRTYAEPIVHSPPPGSAKKANQGFDAFVPLADSGISAYVWTEPKFASILIYSCAQFEDEAAVAFLSSRLGLAEPASMSF
jgi:S-adenosylmethionine/arginine decarboxylase-like enzyme